MLHLSQLAIQYLTQIFYLSIVPFSFLGIIMTFSHHVSSISSSDFPCFWWPCWFWVALVFWQMACNPRVPCVFVFCFFIRGKIVMGLREEYQRDEVPFALHHSKTYEEQSTCSVTEHWPWLCSWGLSGFSCIMFLSPYFCTSLFGKEVMKLVQRWKDAEFSSDYLRAQFRHTLFGSFLYGRFISSFIFFLSFDNF